MSIRCQCTGCGARFEAPGDLAGKTVRCPKCKAAIRVPSGEVAWFYRDTEGHHHGPMPKTELDRLAADGRLDGLCQVRRADWEEWRWIETVYPQFAEHDAAAPPLAAVKPSPPPTPAKKTRLQECPDCGKIVSRRATQCPNCGCPIAAASRLQATDIYAGDEDDAHFIANRKRRTRKVAVLSLLIGMLLVLLGGSGFIGWQLWKLSRQPAEILAPLLELPPAPVPPPPAATRQAATPEQVSLWIDEVAAETARNLDNRYHQLYLAQAGIQALQEQSDLLQSLASGEFAKPAKHDKKQPKVEPPPPYQSQYEPLRQECAAYLRKNVAVKTAERAGIVEMARRWAEGR